MTEHAVKINGKRELIDHLLQSFPCGQLFSFEKFMSVALHHQYGYYSATPGVLIGKNKDFTTCPNLDPIFARSIASWILHKNKKLRKTENLTVIEFGGGAGTMAEIIIETLEVKYKDSFKYILLESNEFLLREQQTRLKDKKNVLWCRTIDEAFESCYEIPFLICNEFIDTFPTRVFRWSTNQWLELFIEIKQGFIHEHLVTPEPSLKPDDWLSQQTILPTVHNQQIEIHSSFLNWWSEWNSRLKNGIWLIIDYGDRFPDLYHRRPRGTLRAYFKNSLLTGSEVYQRIGYQDLTADINFSEIEYYAQALDWRSEGYVELRNFIINNQPKKRFRQLLSEKTYTKSEEYILDPAGAGSQFKVLSLFKNVESLLECYNDVFH